MPVWNKDAIDYDSPLIFCPSGEIIPTKIGCYVMTIEECEKVLSQR
jgi:hypothetical protein